jgi:hypothetical protein
MINSDCNKLNISYHSIWLIKYFLSWSYLILINFNDTILSIKNYFVDIKKQFVDKKLFCRYKKTICRKKIYLVDKKNNLSINL